MAEDIRFPKVLFTSWNFQAICPECGKRHQVVISYTDDVPGNIEVCQNGFTCCGKSWTIRVTNEHDYMVSQSKEQP